MSVNEFSPVIEVSEDDFLGTAIYQVALEVAGKDFARDAYAIHKSGHLFTNVAFFEMLDEEYPGSQARIISLANNLHQVNAQSEIEANTHVTGAPGAIKRGAGMLIHATFEGLKNAGILTPDGFDEKDLQSLAKAVFDKRPRRH
jgi:hypothetical protein